MTRHLGLSSLLLVVAIASFAEGVPKAVVPELVHDFGELGRGARVSTTFVIENHGDAELVIDRVVSTCTCLTTEYEERIPPGGRSEIGVELDTLIVQGPTSSAIKVGTNDPDNPTIRLTVKAMVKNVVYVRPGYFSYEVVRGFRERAAVGQLLWSPDGTPFSITRIETPFPYLTVTHREATAEERERAEQGTENAGSYYWVEAVLSPDAPVGGVSGFLKIFIDHPEQSLVPLPVSVFMRPVFAVTPHLARFGELSIADEPFVQKFLVENFATETIAITKVEPGVDGLELAVEETDKGRTWVVTLTFPPTMPKGPFSGELRIHTESDRAPLVTVPMSGTVL